MSDPITHLHVQDGNRMCRVPLRDLAVVFGVDESQLRDALMRLGTDGAQAVEELRTEFSRDARFNDRNDRYDDVRTKELERSSERYRCPGDEIDDEEYLHGLAEKLGDQANLRALRVLARRHPRAILDEAMRRTLAIPSERIKKSRGACFTAIVRVLNGERETGQNASNYA
jgi:hypothetical protein